MKIHKSSHKQVTLDSSTKHSFQRISWVYYKNDLNKLTIWAPPHNTRLKHLKLKKYKPTLKTKHHKNFLKRLICQHSARIMPIVCFYQGAVTVMFYIKRFTWQTTGASCQEPTRSLSCLPKPPESHSEASPLYPIPAGRLDSSIASDPEKKPLGWAAPTWATVTTRQKKFIVDLHY